MLPEINSNALVWRIPQSSLCKGVGPWMIALPGIGGKLGACVVLASPPEGKTAQPAVKKTVKPPGIGAKLGALVKLAAFTRRQHS